MEIWLSGSRTLCIFWGDVSLTLPLSSTAAGPAGLPVGVTINSNKANINALVSGYGLLPSILSFCPGQGDASNVTDGTNLTDVFVGETYCIRHSVPLLPDGLILTGQRLLLDTDVGQINTPAVPGTLLFDPVGKHVDVDIQMVFQGPQTVTSYLQFGLPNATANASSTTRAAALSPGYQSAFSSEAYVGGPFSVADTSGDAPAPVEPLAQSATELSFQAVPARVAPPTPPAAVASPPAVPPGVQVRGWGSFRRM